LSASGGIFDDHGVAAALMLGAVGGKDRHPFPVPLRVYDETIRVLNPPSVRPGSDGRRNWEH
jgi:hypothetical protein